MTVRPHTTCADEIPVTTPLLWNGRTPASIVPCSYRQSIRGLAHAVLSFRPRRATGWNKPRAPHHRQSPSASSASLARFRVMADAKRFHSSWEFGLAPSKALPRPVRADSVGRVRGPVLSGTSGCILGPCAATVRGGYPEAARGACAQAAGRGAVVPGIRRRSVVPR